VQEVASPALASSGDIRQLVGRAGGEQHVSRLQRAARGEAEGEAGVGIHDAVVEDLHAVAPYLVARGRDQLGRRHAVAREEAVHVLGGRISRRSGVDHDDPAPGPAEHKGGAEPGGPATDDGDVVGPVSMRPGCTPTRWIARFVAVSGNGG
jgi:hypothetical protein